MKIRYTGANAIDVQVSEHWYESVVEGDVIDVDDATAHGSAAVGEIGEPDYVCARAGLLAREDFEAVAHAPHKATKRATAEGGAQ